MTLALSFCGCKQKSAHQPYIPVPNAVAFDLTSSGGNNGIAGEWLATYSSGGKTARFKIVINPIQNASDGIAFGKGRFVAIPGSDSTTLIPVLKAALEAKTMPTAPKRAAYLPFTLANLGDHLSQESNGGFNTNPPGGWTAMKIFIEDGDGDDVELFLNLDPSIGKGQFSIKDADYGDEAVAKLATVL